MIDDEALNGGNDDEAEGKIYETFSVYFLRT